MVQLNRTKKAVTQPPPTRPVIHTGALHQPIGSWGHNLNKKKVWRALALPLFMVIGLLSGCQPSNQQSKLSLQAAKPVVIVHINDYSASTAPLNYFDENGIRGLYYAVAASGGVIKHIGIRSNSISEEVFTLNIPQLDTNSTEGLNVYQASKIKRINEEKLKLFQAQAEKDIARYVAEITKPHTEQNTDLANTLEDLAIPTILQPNFKTSSKFLILATDMINDPQDESATLRPMPLEHTVVCCIRPAISKDSLQALFPGAAVYIFTSATDIISLINKNQ